MKKFILSLIAVFVALFLVSCKCLSSKSGPLMYEADYVLELKSLDDIDEIRVMPSQDVTISFKKEADNTVNVAGCAGVNRYFGKAYLDEANQNINFGRLGATMMMGPGLEVEREYLDELEDVVSFHVCPKTNALTFLDDDNECVLKFRAPAK